MKNRRITILLISLIVLIGSVIFFAYKKDKKVYEDIKENKITLAIMVEKGTGKYVEYKSKEWPKYGYKYVKAECVDRDRNNIGNLVTYDALTNTAYMNSTRTAFCTLYFDKDNSAPVIGDGSFYVGSTVDQEYTNKVNEEVHIKIEDEDVIEYCLSLDSDSRSCEGKWSPIPELTEGWFTVSSFNLGNTDGTKIVYLYLKDGARNISESQDSIVLDTTPPECRIWGESTSWTSGNRTIRWGCDDASSGCKVIETGSKEYKVTTKTAPIAEYEIEDNVGYKTTCNVTANVYVDKDAPSCNISENPTSWTNSNKTLTGSGTDPGEGSVFYKWDTGSYGSTSGANNTKAVSSNGRVTLYVKDSVGNENNCYVDVTKIDKEGPTVATSTIRYDSSTGTIRTNANTWTNKTLWWGNFSATDSGIGVDHYEYSTNCTKNKSGNLSSSYTYDTDRDWTFCIRAVDGLGNPGDWSSAYYFRIDKTKPTISVSNKTADGSAYSGNCTTQNVNSTVTYSDSSSGINASTFAWSDDNSTWHTISGASTTTGTDTWSSNRSQTVYYRICDNATNCNTVSFYLDKRSSCGGGGGSSGGGSTGNACSYNKYFPKDGDSNVKVRATCTGTILELDLPCIISFSHWGKKHYVTCSFATCTYGGVTYATGDSNQISVSSCS